MRSIVIKGISNSIFWSHKILAHMLSLHVWCACGGLLSHRFSFLLLTSFAVASFVFNRRYRDDHSSHLDFVLFVQWPFSFRSIRCRHFFSVAPMNWCEEWRKWPKKKLHNKVVNRKTEERRRQFHRQKQHINLISTQYLCMRQVVSAATTTAAIERTTKKSDKNCERRSNQAIEKQRKCQRTHAQIVTVNAERNHCCM